MDGVLWQTGSPPELFTGFGPSAYFSSQSALETLEVALEHREVRRRLRAVCPTSPGVYGMVDCAGQLIYVGVSAKLCDRLLTYFTAGDDGAKERRIGKHARQVVWELVDHEFTAQLRELELIRRWRPRFNRRLHLPDDGRGAALSCGTPSASGCSSFVGAGTNKPKIAGGDRPSEPRVSAPRLRT